MNSAQKLGYSMLDNAESNDTCLETLARWFPMDVRRRRLRCIGHVISIIVRAAIFGSNISTFEAELRGATVNLDSKSGPRKELSVSSITLLPNPSDRSATTGSSAIANRARR